jgi:competence protein ComEC
MNPLLLPLLALIAGILASPHLVPFYVWLCLPVSIVLGLARRPCLLVAIFLLGAGLASTERPAPELPPGTEASRVVGRLLERPDWRGIGAYLDIAIESVDGTPYEGRARLTEFLDDPGLLELFNALSLGSGDRVEIVVRLRPPARYRNPGVFDYRRYLARMGIFWTGTIRNPRLITVLERGSRLQQTADRLRTSIEAKLDRLFSNDRQVHGLLLGMVLGRKQNIPAEVEKNFQAGGLYHLLVVSGFNLAVVAAATAFLCRYLFASRSLRLAAPAGVAVAYALLVGQQPPVTRATLIVFALLAAKLLDRDYSPLNALALVAFLLLAANPGALEDPSFQMTFVAAGAVTGIGVPAAGWAIGRLRECLTDFANVERDGFLSREAADWRVATRMFCESYRIPSAALLLPWRLYRLVVESVVISLCVEMVFVMFMVESFHRVSPISPWLNVPAGLAAAAITVLGLTATVLPEFLSRLVAALTSVMIEGLLVVVQAAVDLPLSNVRVPSSPMWFWCVYAFAAALVAWGIRKRRRAKCVIGASGVLAAHVVLFVADFSPPPPQNVTATFLDVGQGDSSLIEFPDGRRMLIDGGGVSAGRFLGLREESRFSVGEDVVSAYLFSRGIRRLDVVVLTHAHYDHMDGLFDVLENFQVGELWVGRNPMIPTFRSLLEAAARRGVRLRTVAAGQRIGEFSVVHPPAGWRVRRTADNNDSVVLLLRAGAQTALFTGDLELPLHGLTFVNLLKVPHHGSRGVRMQVGSSVRVLSVGANNPFGHPHPLSLPALRTDELGAIEVRLEGRLPKVRTP